MHENEAKILICMAFPAQNRPKLTGEAARRSGRDRSERGQLIRLICTVLFEQNDDRQSQHRYMMVEAFRQIDTAQIDPLLSIITRAA